MLFWISCIVAVVVGSVGVHFYLAKLREKRREEELKEKEKQISEQTSIQFHFETYKEIVNEERRRKILGQPAPQKRNFEENSDLEDSLNFVVENSNNTSNFARAKYSSINDLDDSEDDVFVVGASSVGSKEGEKKDFQYYARFNSNKEESNYCVSNVVEENSEYGNYKADSSGYLISFNKTQNTGNKKTKSERETVEISKDTLEISRDELPRHMGDWNERFQRTIKMMREFTTNTPLKRRIRVGRDLINLYQDFIYSSCTYGKIIISEIFLPEDEKTIKPKEMGGVAGGKKYIVGNILFKFALDSNGLYGSDFAAAKVAGHELKGLIALMNTGTKELCFPLVNFQHKQPFFKFENPFISRQKMSLVDYRGFRLIAISFLPIDSNTIIYGSNDYGRTIHQTKNPRFLSALEKASKGLNIQVHKCGPSKEDPATVYGPVDLEGHKGRDNRFYLLDFSRVMPPETPMPGVQMAHLFRLLRPEFVKNYKEPLCSDGFSAFIKFWKAKEQNSKLIEATNSLLNETIPSFANELEKVLTETTRVKGLTSLYEFRLSEAVHRKGINIRYLGVLRQNITQPDVRSYLIIEVKHHSHTFRPLQISRNLFRFHT